MAERRHAYVLILRKGRVLVVKNRWGRWTLPGGRARPGERLRAAARREVGEETGTTVVLGRRISGGHVRHHRRRCDGCVLFTASISKGKVKPQREITAAAWVTPEKALRRLRSFRSKPLRSIIRDAL
jgi:8-oxo-dGTP pyrophosphatase MutT (NUDIX family)